MHQRRGEDDVATPDLDPGHLAASVDRERGERLDEVGQHLARDHEALHADVGLTRHPLRRRGEVSHRASHAHDPLAGAPERGIAGQRLAHVRAHALEVLLLGRPGAGEELLGDPDGAERERAQRLRATVRDLDQLDAAAAGLQHDPVGHRRAVERGHVAEARLRRVGDDLDLQAARGAGGLEEPRAVGGVADRAGRDGVDRVTIQAVGGAEALEHRERLEAASHPFVAEAPGLRQAGADPYGLEDLVGELPPVAGDEHVDDQPPRVGSEVDDADSTGVLARVPGRSSRSPAHVP